MSSPSGAHDWGERKQLDVLIVISGNTTKVICDLEEDKKEILDTPTTFVSIPINIIQTHHFM